MAVAVSLRKWNSDSSSTNDFEIITKITTLGNPTENKSILGYFLSFRQNTEATSSVSNSFVIQLSYRFELDKQWTTLYVTTSSLGNSAFQSGNNWNIKIILGDPIVNVKQIQLRLSSPLLRGDFNINDFGLIYRTIRDTSVSDHDED